MSNGVVNRLVLFLMLDAIFGYLRSNHLGSTNEKNGIRSSSLPCCVLRTDANLHEERETILEYAFNYEKNFRLKPRLQTGCYEKIYTTKNEE